MRKADPSGPLHQEVNTPYDADKAKQERDWWAQSALGESYVIPSYRRKQLIQRRDRLLAISKQLDPGEIAQNKPRSLYIARKVTNADDVINWAKDQGFATTLLPDDLHVTVCYSKTPLLWPPMAIDGVVIEGGERALVRFDGGATVLRFTAPQLANRHYELRNKGASSDYERYQPHITLSYDAADVDLANITPYSGPIHLGSEYAREITESFDPNTLVEKTMEKLAGSPLEDPVSFRIAGRDDSAPTESKESVAYQWTPRGDERCGRCSMFRGPRNCTLVQGDISPDGWCTRFDRHKSYRHPQHFSDTLKSAASWKDDVMEKIGARHSRGDVMKIQDIHDNAVALGAKCPQSQEAADSVVPRGELDKADYRIAKVDESLGMVFGYSIICKVDGQDYYDLNVDLAGEHKGQRVPEHIPETVMLKAAVDFAQSARVGNEMHKGDDVGNYLFVFPLTSDIAKAMNLTTKVTGLMVGFKPPPELFAKFKDGTLKGFSIEGRRLAYSEHD